MFTVRLSETPRDHRGGQVSYLLLTSGQFGSRNLSMTWVEGAPGSEQESHQHDNSEQAYVIVAGHGLMRVAGEEEEVGPGTLVFVPPGSPHSIRNIGPEPLVYVSATAPPFPVPPGRWSDRPKN